MGKRITLVTADELRTLIARVDAELDAIGEEEERADDGDRRAQDELSERSHAADRAFMFCVAAAGWLRDASFLPFLVWAASLASDNREERGVVAAAVGEILAAGAVASAEVATLAKDRDIEIRLAVAANLAPRGEAAIRILEALATTDPWDHVRARAKAQLGGVREIAWWEGAFAADPLRAVPDADAERLRAPLEAIARLLALSGWEQDKRAGELCDAVAALPDELAVDLLTRRFTASGKLPDDGSAGLLALLATRSARAFLDVVRVWGQAEQSRYSVAARLEKAATLMEPAPRRATARHLLAAALSLEHAPTATLAAAAAAALWPSDADPTPVLDAALQSLAEERPEAQVASALLLLFRRADLDVRPIAERVAEARVAGYPGAWQKAGYEADTLLARAPLSVVRPAAERAILSEDRATIAWGLLQLAGRCHDPARDPAVPALLAAAYADPRLRAAMATDWRLGVRVLPWARADLRAGRLGYREAAEVMLAIDLVWGGLAVPTYSSREAQAKTQESRRDELGVLLGPPEVHGPPTEAEWRVFRAQRDAALADAEDRASWVPALRVFPDGPWIPEDRAFLVRAGALACAAELAYLVMSAIGSRPDLELLPLAEQAYVLDSDDVMTRDIRALRGALGVTVAETTPAAKAAVAEPSAAAPAAPPREWMDEPDDD